MAIDRRFYVGCGGMADAGGIGSAILIVDRDIRILRSRGMWMYGIDSITAAGPHAIAVSGAASDAPMCTRRLRSFGSRSGNLAPLGQGQHNYMLGHYFYVVVTDENKNSMTYRYDVFRLDRPPVRMRSAF